MAKPDLGTKRTCAECDTRYYDLKRDPILCPKCGAVFKEQVRPAPRASASAKPEAAVQEEELETVSAGAVSLEEADKEQTSTGAKAVPLDADDFEVDDDTLDDDDVDDTFLAEEEEDDSDVSDIIGGGIDADDEDV